MARVVTCPSCQARGSIPDDARVSRIRCPKCQTVYRVGDGEASTMEAAPVPAGGRPVPTPRKASAVPVSGTHAGGPSPQMLLYGLIGLSGLVVVLLGVVMALLLGGGSRSGDGPGPAVATAPPGAAATPPALEKPATQPELVATVATAPNGPTLGSSTAAAVNAFNGAPSLSGSPEPTKPEAPPDREEVVRRLKDATVLVNIKIGKKLLGNGSGFVIEVNGEQAVIATNRHVAVMEPGEIPSNLLSKGAKPELEAVFRSGEGPQKEQAVTARLIAADLSGGFNTDLAFLTVQGVKNPPRPIDPTQIVRPTEGMTYLGAGFPRIDAKISSEEGKPSVVVTGGRISSFRRDEYGQVLLLQVDGSIQPGNSGGPIVDEKTGKLLGVAVASASFADTIGLIVPADQVRRELAGRVGGLALTLERMAGGKASLLVKANLVDPKLQVSAVEVRAVPLAKVGKLSPNSDGSWPPLPGSTPVELQKSVRDPSAAGRIEVAITGAGQEGRKVWVQAAHRDMRGRIVYSRPKEVYLPDHPGPIRENGSLRKILKQVMAKSISQLGSLIDPSTDCRLDRDDRSLKVRIDLPGKLHTLSPDYKSPRGTPYHNAPMTLADVDGDFVAHVSVTGEINPGSTLPKDRAARGLPFTFQSAGLVLYQDKNNFLRLERASSIFTARLTPVHRLLLEIIKDGKPKIQPIYLDIPEGDTELVMVRRKGRVRCMFSPAGTGSMVTFREFAVDYPPKVKVGLTASNISAQTFSATFQGFALLTDTTQIDEGLEDD